MKILRHRIFKKKYKRLSASLREKVNSAIREFDKNPSNPSLKNHPLKGKMQGKRAFSVTGDVRVIFEEFDDYVLVVMLDVGGS